MLGDARIVEAVLEDYRTAPVSEPERRLLSYVEKLNAAPATVSGDDIAALHECGWTDEAIYDAATVCALFNFYNRWVDGTGVPGMSAEAYGESGRRLARFGYAARK